MGTLITATALRSEADEPAFPCLCGDAVFELFVREKLVCAGNCPVKTLHRRAVEQVCCQAQSAAGQRLFDSFTPEEQDIYRRGRNAHVNHVPKNAEPADYHAATALEALVGYLYLKGDLSRLQALFACCLRKGRMPKTAEIVPVPSQNGKEDQR